MNMSHFLKVDSYYKYCKGEHSLIQIKHDISAKVAKKDKISLTVKKGRTAYTCWHIHDKNKQILLVKC